MDRPEWIDTFPDHLTAIATLTNNTARGTAAHQPAVGAAATFATPRTRGRRTPTATSSAGPTDTTSREPTFGWDIFALGGDPADTGSRVDDHR